jgi:hypothetical protein
LVTLRVCLSRMSTLIIIFKKNLMVGLPLIQVFF